MSSIYVQTTSIVLFTIQRKKVSILYKNKCGYFGGGEVTLWSELQYNANDRKLNKPKNITTLVVLRDFLIH